MKTLIINKELQAIRDDLEDLSIRLNVHTDSTVANALGTLAANLRVLIWHVDQLWQRLDT